MIVKVDHSYAGGQSLGNMRVLCTGEREQMVHNHLIMQSRIVKSLTGFYITTGLTDLFIVFPHVCNYLVSIVTSQMKTFWKAPMGRD